MKPVGAPNPTHLVHGTKLGDDEPTPKVSRFSNPYMDGADPVVAGPVADPSAPPPVLPYLTPDAMLTYCQSRLSSISSQCSDLMTRQEKSAAEQTAVGELLNTLYRFQDGPNGQDAVIRAAYHKAIDAVGADSTVGQQLTANLNDLDGHYDKNGMAGAVNGAKTIQSQLNSDSEIDMIHIQSLMSQRQTAVQLTTNIVQSLNDQANKIVANIGH